MKRELIALQAAVGSEFVVERELGRGGMGVVWLAREVALDRLVALKVLPEGPASDPHTRQRFLREARYAASLSHPHIVPIFRVLDTPDCAAFVMAYIEGETLGAQIRAGRRLSPERAARLMTEMGWALAYAHDHGIIHKDIKPDNILIERETGRALLSDFGIATSRSEGPQSDTSGTPGYMSPEQATGGLVDARSDVYALGLLVRSAVGGDDGAVSSSGDLGGIVRRCMRVNPAERYQSATQLVQSLESIRSVKVNEVAPALRAWLEGRDPLRPYYALWVSFCGAGAAVQLWHPVGTATKAVALGCLPILPLLLGMAYRARRAMAAGYSLEDMRWGLGVWRRELAERASLDSGEHEAKWKKVLRLSLWTSIGVAVLNAPFLNQGATTALGTVLFNAIIGSVLGSVVLTNALGVPAFGPRFKAWSTGRLREMFWRSRAGGLLARVIQPSRPAPLAVHRPTELVLGGAIAVAHAGLPASYRGQFRELPEAAKKLSEQVGAARERLRALAAAEAQVGRTGTAASWGGAEYDSLRGAAQRDFESGLAALQRLHAEMLRLQVSVAGEESESAAIRGAANSLASELARLNDAHEEIRGALLQPRGQPTPA